MIRTRAPTTSGATSSAGTKPAGIATALTFAWDIFVLAGNPKKYADRTDLKSGSAAITVDNQFNSPTAWVSILRRPPLDPDRRQLHQRR
jgi:hypothetical protein